MGEVHGLREELSSSGFCLFEFFKEGHSGTSMTFDEGH